jgi:opacity protein-like surface antigen
MFTRLVADWGKIVTAAMLTAAFAVMTLATEASAQTETAPSDATDSIELALPPTDDAPQSPYRRPQRNYYDNTSVQTHSFGAAVGVGSIYGEVEDPYRDDHTTPSSQDIAFLYRYQLVRYLAVAGDLQFIQGSAEFNHNGVENDVVINRYGNLDISIIPMSIGLVLSPGLLNFNPYLAAGATFAFWDARRDWILTQDGTERTGYYDHASGNTYGYYIAGGIKLKPRKYYSYFIEFRYTDLKSREVIAYDDFDLSNFIVNIGFLFDYLEETTPRY